MIFQIIFCEMIRREFVVNCYFFLHKHDRPILGERDFHFAACGKKKRRNFEAVEGCALDIVKISLVR